MPDKIVITEQVGAKERKCEKIAKQKYPCDKCDEACFYHCTKNGTQKPECKK